MKKVITSLSLLVLTGFAVSGTLIDITPGYTEQGEALTVFITGQNTDFCIDQMSSTVNNVKDVYLEQGSAVIDAASFSFKVKTGLCAGFAIPFNAAIGLYDVTVVEIDNSVTSTLTNGFTIQDPNAPKIVDVVPKAGEQGEALTVSITGRNTEFCIEQGSETTNNVSNVYFKQGNSVIEATGITIVNETSVNAGFSIPTNAVLGLYNVAVVQTSPRDTLVRIDGFTIDPSNTPKIVTVDPDSVEQGQALAVSITGEKTDFCIDQASETTDNVSTVYLKQFNTVIEADSFSIASKTCLTAGFTIPANASFGVYDVAVVQSTKGDTASLHDGFKILQQIQEQMIAHWTFDERQGDSAYDISGNDNHFELLNGVTWVDGLNGGIAVAFDGIDDKGICADRPCHTDMKALTIETVIWIDEYPSNNHWGPIIIKWGSGSNNDDSWGLDINRISPFGGHAVVVGTSTASIVGTTPLPIRKWIHFVFTWEDTKIALYLDGVKVDSNVVPSIGKIQNSNTEMLLGHNSDPHFFKGKIDQVRLYNYALDSETIIAHYDSLYPVDIQDNVTTIDYNKNSVTMNSVSLVIFNTEKLPIEIALYSISGRMLVENKYKAARNVVRVDMSNLASGVYFLKLKSGSRVLTRRFVIRR